jgi:ribulose-phosphate 3-epimerase
MEWLPSLFAANPLYLGNALHQIATEGYTSVHIDVMDGHFVPNISLGLPVIAAIRAETPTLFRDVHLMLAHPEHFIDACIRQGAQRIFIPIEIDANALQASLHTLRASTIEWGFAINPETPLSALLAHKDAMMQSHRLLVMSVHPGFSGQTFIEATYERIRAIREQFPQLPLCVDGGIRPNIAERLAQCGVTSCVIGSYCFQNP